MTRWLLERDGAFTEFENDNARDLVIAALAAQFGDHDFSLRRVSRVPVARTRHWTQTPNPNRRYAK